MKDACKTKAQLIQELQDLRSRVERSEEAEVNLSRLETELRRSRQSLVAFLDATTELALLIDTEGNIVALNQLAAER